MIADLDFLGLRLQGRRPQPVTAKEALLAELQEVLGPFDSPVFSFMDFQVR
jgi:hypothetical protein